MIVSLARPEMLRSAATQEQWEVHRMANRLRTRPQPWLAGLLAAVFLSAASSLLVAQPDTDSAAGASWQVAPSWKRVSADAVHAKLVEYMTAAAVSPERQLAASEQWAATSTPAAGPDELLNRLAACLALVDDRVAELVEFCETVSQQPVLPEFAWLANSETPLLVRNNMRLYLARWLVQEGYYDEALAWTAGLETDDVVAPEALLFSQAVAHHRLVQSDKADAAVTQLLQRSDELPLRYQKLAALIQQDLAGLEDDSLDHIARRMEDIRRHLAKGRSGERVQVVETSVIESLDKLIKNIEDQLQQQQQAMAAASGGQQSSTPMQDSQLPAGPKAPGEVDRRDLSDGSGWGNMSDKDREKALQDIGREFPSHYREVVEEYFRRLAAEKSAESE